MVEFRGTVLTAEDRVPIPNATVHLRVVLGRRERLTFQTTSDEQARFSIIAPFDESMAHASSAYVMTPGRTAATHAATLQRPVIDFGEIHLHTGPTLAGTVREYSGEPVEGAEIDAGPVWKRNQRPGLRWDDWPPLCKTDESGRYEYSGPGLSFALSGPQRPDLFIVGVRHPDHLPAEDYSVLEKLKETGTTVVDFTLLKREVTGVEPRVEITEPPPKPEARFPLALQVRDQATDSPISGGSVDVQLSEGTVSDFEFFVPIGPDGQLEVYTVPAGTYGVSLAQNLSGGSVRVTVTEDGTCRPSIVRFKRSPPLKDLLGDLPRPGNGF